MSTTAEIPSAADLDPIGKASRTNRAAGAGVRATAPTCSCS